MFSLTYISCKAVTTAELKLKFETGIIRILMHVSDLFSDNLVKKDRRCLLQKFLGMHFTPFHKFERYTLSLCPQNHSQELFLV